MQMQPCVTHQWTMRCRGSLQPHVGEDAVCHFPLPGAHHKPALGLEVLTALRSGLSEGVEEAAAEEGKSPKPAPFALLHTQRPSDPTLHQKDVL